MNVNPSSVGPAASFSQSLDPLRRPPAGDGGNGTRPVSPGGMAKAVEASGQTQRHRQAAPPRDAAPPAPPPPSGTPSRDIPRGSFVDISA